jgi:hypothetical protein
MGTDIYYHCLADMILRCSLDSPPLAFKGLLMSDSFVNTVVPRRACLGSLCGTDLNTAVCNIMDLDNKCACEHLRAAVSLNARC